MDEVLDDIGIVRKAQGGDRDSLDRLAELARERLGVFVYRLTLDQDLSQEIVQESMVEMFKVLGKLREADRFWPWLYGIATNKLRRHHRTERTRRKAAEIRARRDSSRTLKEAQDGLDRLVGQELKDIVAGAMKKLKTSHRAVLIMRCYDGMSYADIATSMGSSEFGTRMLFMRAKRALQKQLSRNGFGKGSLLAALVVFGKMTAPSEAAAAEVSVSAATVSVGTVAGLVGAVTSKTAVVSVATAGVLAVGSVTVGPNVAERLGGGGGSLGGNAPIVGPWSTSQADGEEHWYYYPEGVGKPMMMRVRSAPGESTTYSQYLANEQGNYFYKGSEVHTNNHRAYAADLSVTVLPTDSRELRDFIARVQGGRGSRKMQAVPNRGAGLLVIATPDAESGGNRSWVTRHFNVLDEDYFRCDWPADVRTVDNRDEMHARGWTYFTVAGEIRGQTVSGAGRLPFVYEACKQHTPWLRLEAGGGLQILDTADGAYVRRAGASGGRAYKGGSFFAGLARPWMGLHTVDTVRRDAALKGIWFQTEPQGGAGARVTLQCGAIELVYTIDLGRDLVERIEFVSGEETIGSLNFTYLQDVSGAGAEFRAPSSRSYGPQLTGAGVSWLAQLAEGTMEHMTK